MRQEVRDLVRLGQLPDEDAPVDVIARQENAISKITPPLSDDEARAAVRLFGPDDCYGLAWSLLHLVESAPGWPLLETLTDENDWLKRLRARAGLQS